MGLNEAIAELLGHEKPEEVVALLRTKGQPLFQKVFQEGYDVAYGKRAGEVKTAETERDAAKVTATTALKELEQERAKAPEVQAVRTQFQTEIADLQAKHKAELTTVRGETTAERKARARQDLITHLERDFRVDPEIAAAKVDAPGILERVTFDPAGTVTVMQAGKQIPLAPAAGQSPLRTLAEELKASVNPKYILAGGDTGSGDSGGAGAGGGAPGGKNRYDVAREEVKTTLADQNKDTQAARKLAGLDPLTGMVPAR